MTYRAGMRAFVAGIFLGLLVSCGGMPPIVAQPADPAVAHRIVQACTASGLFKTVAGFALAAVPAGPLASSVIDAGVDRVCADPQRFAGDISTVEWVAKNLAAAVRSRL